MILALISSSTLRTSCSGLLVSALVSTAFCACGGVDDRADAATFVALQGGFAPYRTWTSVDLGSTPLAGHPVGPRIAYVNHVLAPGSDSYPVGTIIVKEIQTGAPATTPDAYELFAMVKRGGGFNADGAVGWEFVILRLDASGTPIITDRGVSPTSDLYSMTSSAGCNTCHGAAGSDRTDHILDAPLQPGHGG